MGERTLTKAVWDLHPPQRRSTAGQGRGQCTALEAEGEFSSPITANVAEMAVLRSRLPAGATPPAAGAMPTSRVEVKGRGRA